MSALFPGGIHQISSDGDDGMRVKIKTQKHPYGFQHNPKKPLYEKLILKISHAKFLTLKSFQKGLNDISTAKGNFSDDKHDG